MTMDATTLSRIAHRTAARRISDPWLAEDVAQDALLHAIRRERRSLPPAQMKLHVRTAASNHFRREAKPHRGCADIDGLDPISREPDPSDAAAARELWRMVSRALASLSERDRAYILAGIRGESGRPRLGCVRSNKVTAARGRLAAALQLASVRD